MDNKLKLVGVVIKKFETKTGVSKKANKTYESTEFLIEIGDKYKKTIIFSDFGKCGVKNINVGDEVKVYFDILSREYNGRYYTNLVAYKTEVVEKENNQTEQQQEAAPVKNTENDDLPF